MPYLGKTPSQATRQRYYLTASGGETSISGTMTTGGTLTFNDGEFVDVKLNGVSLVAGTDYNTSTANTIAGLSALSANDQVEIVVYDTFSVFSGDVDSNLSVGGNLSVTGTSALTGAATITTDDNNPQLTLTTTDADAGTGPTLDLFRDSASPADADVGGKISFTGKNDAGETLGMAIFQASHVDVSDGTEDAKLAISSRSAGSMVSRLNLDATETVFNEDSVDLDFRVESNGNANMLFVDAGNDLVGIGQGTPDAELHIGDGGGSSDNTRLRLTGGTSGLSTIQFGDTDSANIGQLQYDHSNNFLAVRVNASERMRITSAGAIGINESSPSTFLHIDNGGSNGSGQADAIRVHNPGTTAGDGAGIKFSAGGSTTGAAIFGIGQATNSCNLVFRAGGDTERMRLNSSGQLRLGDVFTGTFPGSDQQTLMVTGSVGIKGDSTCIRFYSDSAEAQVGSIQLNTNATIYNTTSDYRVKESVVNMSGAIDRVKQLAPKRFNFISDPDDTTVDGFLAHEVQTVVPEAISGTRDAIKVWTQQEIDHDLAPDGTSAGDNKLDADGNTIPELQGIDHSKLVPLLTGALREAIAKIETLETKVAALEAGE